MRVASCGSRCALRQVFLPTVSRGQRLSGALVCVLVLRLLFPNGRPRRRRWAWCAVGVVCSWCGVRMLACCPEPLCVVGREARCAVLGAVRCVQRGLDANDSAAERRDQRKRQEEGGDQRNTGGREGGGTDEPAPPPQICAAEPVSMSPRRCALQARTRPHTADHLTGTQTARASAERRYEGLTQRMHMVEHRRWPSAAQFSIIPMRWKLRRTNAEAKSGVWVEGSAGAAVVPKSGTCKQ